MVQGILGADGMILKSMLHIAVFLNCWVIGRTLIIDPTDNGIEDFLRLIFSVAGFNIFVLVGVLLTK